MISNFAIKWQCNYDEASKLREPIMKFAKL
jgi:hypothetical protein